MIEILSEEPSVSSHEPELEELYQAGGILQE